MKRLSYADVHVVTDDRVADAVLRYAATLAIVGSSDVIDIPAVDTDGIVRRVVMIIGPASEIVTMEVGDAHVEMLAEEAVEELKRRGQTKLPTNEDILDADVSPKRPF